MHRTCFEQCARHAQYTYTHMYTTCNMRAYGTDHGKFELTIYNQVGEYHFWNETQALRILYYYYGRRTCSWCLRAGIVRLSSKDSQLCWRGVRTRPPNPPWLRAWLKHTVTTHPLPLSHPPVELHACNFPSKFSCSGSRRVSHIAAPGRFFAVAVKRFSQDD